MTTASSLISDIQTKVGDASGNYLTASLALTWLDQAQKQYVTRLLPLDRTKSFVVTANQEAFTVPDESIMLMSVLVSRDYRHPMKYLDVRKFEAVRSSIFNATGYPTYWTEKDGKIYVWPRFTSASLTSTLNATSAASNTTLTLASTGNLRSAGRAIVGTEEIEYTAKTSTTLTGVTRGVGGTTAASYASAQLITQTDLEYVYSRHAAALSLTSEPEIKEAYHENLQWWVMYLYYSGEGANDKAMACLQVHKELIKESEYNEGRVNIADPMSMRRYDGMGDGFYGPL